MKDFGAKAEWTSDHTLQVAPLPYHPVPYYVESDWSAASYWYEIVALSKHEAVVTLPGLFAQSPQGDAKVAELFEQLGVCTQREGNSVTLKQTHTHTDRMEYNFVNQPDLAQTFVVTCAMLGIPFRFSGLQSLKIKETDRMAEKLRTEAEAMKAEYEQNLQNARTEANQIVAAAQKTAAARSEELLGEARAQAAALKQKAEDDIAQERKKAVNEVKDEIGGMAMEIASKVVEREIKEADHQDLIDEFIKNVGEAS